jgi:fructose-bisphosphate aldolase class I
MHEAVATIELLLGHDRGVLAADEDQDTIAGRFAKIGLQSTSASRRSYREWLFTTPGLERFVGGVIMHEETTGQSSQDGTPFTALLQRRGIICGAKMDKGRAPIVDGGAELRTLGLEGLSARLADYREKGLSFAKWRSAFVVDGNSMPSRSAIELNCEAMALAAAQCQQEGLVPFVEPDILMNGPHGIARCQEVSEEILRCCISALIRNSVVLEDMVLKTNMVTPGADCARQVPSDEIAQRTLKCLRLTVPAVVPAILFLSGGMTLTQATTNLNAINAIGGLKPWRLSFAFGRALRGDAFQIWAGDEANVAEAQRALLRDAHLSAAASAGKLLAEPERSQV